MKYTLSKSNSLVYAKMIGKDLQIQFITKKKTRFSKLMLFRDFIWKTEGLRETFDSSF